MADTRRYRQKQSRGFSLRKAEIREPIQRFLIVCEGEKTEPNYFRSFRVPKDVIDLDIEGLGYNTDRLVQEAIERKRGEDYDQVWCVFDRNSHPAQHFNNAIALAGQNGIFVAYSNEAFEFWYLLHFDYCDTATHRRDCCRKLDRLLGHRYEKNSETIYFELIDRQQTAIRNATRLLSEYDPPNPESDNPSTTAHLLVIELNKFIH